MCGTWSPAISPWKTSGGQSFTLSGSTDALAGINTAEGSCTTGTSNGNTCTVGISDLAGNTATCTSPQNRVDITPPTSVSMTRTSASPTNSETATFSLSATDAESGVTQMQFSCNNTNWSTAEAYAISKSLNITNFTTGCNTTNGTKTIYVRFINGAGGTTDTSSTLVYDTVNPVCGTTWTPAASPWKTSGGQSFTLSGSTDALAGINTAGGSCTTGTSNGNTCTVGISDLAGNTATCTSPVNRVDTTVPTSLTIGYLNGTTNSTTQSITFSATDAESGVASYTLYRRSATLTNNTCGTYGSWTSLGVRTSGYSDSMTSGNCYQYYVLATNEAGGTANTTTSPTATTKVDTGGPTCGAWSPTSSPWKTSGGQLFTLSGSTDAISGINTAGGSCTTGTANGNTCTVTISDNAGNTTSCTSPVNNVDATLPTCGTWTPNPAAWKTTAATQTFTLASSTDSGGSGINVAGGSCNATNTHGATCTVNISDNAGNTRTCTSPQNRIDTVNPVCGTWSPSVSPWKASGGQEFTLSGSTDATSGINTAGGTCTTGTVDGNTCSVTISDHAGRTTVCTSPANRVDSSIPLFYTESFSESTWYRNFTGNVASARDAESGLTTFRYAWNRSTTAPAGISSTNCTGGTAVATGGTTSKVITTAATAPSGTSNSGNDHYLHTCAVNGAGAGAYYRYRFYLDATLPTLLSSATAPTCVIQDVIPTCTNKVRYTFSNMTNWISDAHSGRTGGSARVTFTHNGVSGRLTDNTGYYQYNSTNATYVYAYTITEIRDNAGNSATVSGSRTFTCTKGTDISVCPS